jgi:hypothetical protein
MELLWMDFVTKLLHYLWAFQKTPFMPRNAIVTSYMYKQENYEAILVDTQLNKPRCGDKG